MSGPPSYPAIDRSFSEPIRFSCLHCSTSLILPPDTPASSGPCPRCGGWIEAPNVSGIRSTALKSIPLSPDSRRRSPVAVSGKGRLRADGFIDHAYSDRQELFGTLRILTVGLTVFAIITFVTLYLRNWVTY